MLDSVLGSVEMSSLEAGEAKMLTGVLRSTYNSPQDMDFLQSAAEFGRHLPDTLRNSLRQFRYAESPAAVLVSGYPVEEENLGPTPAHWNLHSGETTRDLDFWLMVVCAQLGEPFGWSFLQNGRIITDVLPIKEKEQEQSGHASLAHQYLHNEDAFHECRADYVALTCLRNSGIPTTVSPVTTDGLTAGEVDTLFEPRFEIRADLEHSAGLGESQSQVVSALHGDRERPYSRIDPPFMSALPGDAAAQKALDTLFADLESRAVEVSLEPGDVLIVDNYRAVHGRRGFPARYDGADRWLRRTTLTRDLRKSRTFRRSSADRIIQRA